MLKFGELSVGGKDFCLMAGPCSIESQEHLLEVASYVKAAGTHVLRGGIYKLRTQADSFQGLGENAYKFVAETKKSLNMPFITEVTDPRQISDLYEVSDIFQVGSRNMYNYSLLKELANYDKPVLLKRGFSATVKEWIHAAEYIEKPGLQKVMLCERGVRGFDSVTRNILDLASVSYLKQNTHYPVIVDPSHGTGVRNLVRPMALAAIAAGADGLIIETHPEPDKAWSDGFQSLNKKEFIDLVSDIKAILPMFGKTFS